MLYGVAPLKPAICSCGARSRGGIIGLAAWGGFYEALSKSSWIGRRCPSCSSRGTVDDEQVGSVFLGRSSVRSGNGITTYEDYLVTTAFRCSACGDEWETTSRTRRPI